jgi:hypothetical protein
MDEPGPPGNSVLKWPDLDAVLAVNNRMYGLD